jgi:formylglycine-generating enzyme
VRCPVCEHENKAGAQRCGACDQLLDGHDRPEAILKYQRAFEKLTTGEGLSEKGAKQCAKLREKLLISDAYHEQLLATLEGTEEDDPPILALAISWSSGHCADVAIIHRGDFTFEHIEISVLSTLTKKIHREKIEDLDPDDRRLFQVPLFASENELGSLSSLGVQVQIKAVDITEEVICYRSPLLSLSGGDVELIDLKGVSATPFHELIERRALFSLLGSEGWRELPLTSVEEDEFFRWEVKVATARDWLKRSSADGWRIGDQRACVVDEVTFHERLCPGGVSWIGAPLGVGRDWETPAHQVKISGPLWCAETAVTQVLWMEIMGDNPSSYLEDENPVESVSWYSAVQFCNRLSKRLGLSPVYRFSEDGRALRQTTASGFRLPTEAEWEHLARGGLDRSYAGSNRPEQVCWSIEESEHHPHTVAAKKPNAWGLFDFSGNVWEWCEDYFVEDAYRKRLGLFTDPCVQSPPHGVKVSSRVRRGGSWATDLSACRVFTRADGRPQWASQFVGFRVVRLERRGVSPSDRSVHPDQASWAHLQLGPVYLSCVLGSPRRSWAIRLESLGVKLTLDEEQAGVVIIIPPRDSKPNKASWDKLAASRRRAQGIGALVLDIDQAHEFLAARESEIHEIEQSEDRWDALYGKKVLIVGRFRLTQKKLIARLSSRGVLVTVDPKKAEVLIAGGGKLAKKRILDMSSRGVLILNEVECLAILDTRFAIPL